VIAELIADSTQQRTLMESQALARALLSPDERREADKYIRTHQDFTSYHLLFALKQSDQPAYDALPAATRASILCSALSQLHYLNDWGHLTVAPKDGPPMIALVETKEAAMPCLIPLLEDRRPAPFFGSADATVAAQYRRSDFACHAVMLIRGETPAFATDPKVRDQDIARVAASLR
jgi:hypothetical protein